MKHFSFTITCCLLSLTTYAQFNPDSVYYTASRLSVGYGSFNGGKLQSFAPNLPAPDPEHFVFGLATTAMNRNFAFDFKMLGVTGSTVGDNQMELQKSAFTFGVNVGYPLLYTTKHKIYPLVGAAWVIEYLQMNQKGDLNLQQVQQDFKREIHINKGNLGFDFSLNWDFVPKWKQIEDSDRYGGFLIGLSAGYLYTVANDNWNYSGGSINDAPSYGTQGFYMKLTFGAATSGPEE